LHVTSRELLITASASEYRVYFDSKLSNFQFPKNSILLADDRFRMLLQNYELPKIFIEAEEKNKSLETCSNILSQLQELGATKSTIIVAIGGGIVQDVTTLVASLYMRGLPWVYFPTTKMSQLDSCVGGKSSINLKGKKNIVGNIYPPKEIHLDFSFDETLTREALASGFLEGIKISFASGDADFLQNLKIAENYTRPESISRLEISQLVLSQKKHFIEEDEFDTGIRQNLNFGHTFGHAIESATKYSIQHGLAIGLGMLMAIHHPMTVASENVYALKTAVFNIIRFADKASVSPIFEMNEDKFIECFMADKKHVNGNYTVILPNDQGLARVSLPWGEDSPSLIISLLRQLRLELSNEI
jgi:3-dehydroquinate synthase